jgi:spermidine synthase
MSKKISPPIPVTQYLIVSFFSGFAVLSLEMLGFRFLAPYFGYSTYVWGGLLGSIMAALSGGYYLGGILADKKPEGRLAYQLILYATIYLVGILIFYKSILGALTSGGIIWGSLAASVFLFGPPMLLLGMLSPFIIKIIAQKDAVGMASGKVFAISTWGSLAGVFFTSFYLIPEWGSFRTLTFIIILLAILYVSGNCSNWLKIGIGAALIAFTTIFPNKPASSGVVYQTESAYNLIQIKKNSEGYSLHLNDGRWSHSRYKKGFISTGNYYDFMLLGTLLTPFKDVLILGTGAGTSIRQFLFFEPDVHIDAVELDPKVVEAGKNFFNLPDHPNLKIYVEDARPFLTRIEKEYDVIEMDIFAGGPFVPFYLSTQEYFKLISTKLKPQGLLLMNALRIGQNDIFADRLGQTILKEFPSLFKLILNANVLLIATKKETSLEELKEILKNQNTTKIKPIVEYTLQNLQNFPKDIKSDIFTDDQAPAERLVYEMVKDSYN